MTNYLNQKGYTLLLTLVLVVLLLMLTATFTIASMNQQKQVSKTDDSFVSTSLAEMGVEYYQNRIEIIISNHYSKAIMEIQAIQNNATLSTEAKTTEISSKITSYNSLINTDITTFLNTESASTAIREVASANRAYKLQSYTKEEFTDATSGFTRHVLTLKVAGVFDATATRSIDMKMSYPKLSLPLINGSPTLPTISFDDYKDLYLNDPSKVTVLNVPTISNPGFSFKENTFYYFPISVTFDSQQFNSQQNKDLGNIKVLAADGVFFLKHVRIDNSFLKVKTISFTFSSNAKSDILNSTLVTNTISFTLENTNGNSIKEDDKRVTLINTNVCIESPLSSSAFSQVKSSFKHGDSSSYKVIYKLSNDVNAPWYQMTAASDQTVITQQQKDTVCNLTITDPNGVIDPGTSIEDINYN